MVKWFGRGRQQKLKAEALEIGLGAVDRLRAGIAQWRFERLSSRREMTANGFDERVSLFEPYPGMTLSDTLNLEALSLLRVWSESREKIMDEAADYLDADDLAIVETLGARAKIGEAIEQAWLDEDGALSDHIDQTITEALARAQRV